MTGLDRPIMTELVSEGLSSLMVALSRARYSSRIRAQGITLRVSLNVPSVDTNW